MDGWALFPPRASISDEALAGAFVAGEVTSFDRLVERYTPSVFVFCLRMVGRKEDAEDLTQEVFVQLLRSLPAARTDLPLRPWIFVIARNKCLDFLKRRRPLPFSSLADPATGELAIPDKRARPEEVAEQADQQRLLQQAIASLPERYRAVVALRYASDLTFAEIGLVLGLPANTAKTHFQRAKALLRESLSSLL